jgi:MraZ protein
VYFSGSSEVSIDDKGRIVIPEKYRTDLGANFVVAKGNSGCLSIMTSEYWELKFASKFEDMEMLDEEAELLARWFCAEALVNCNPDSQGRISISSSLREYADLKPGHPVMILGMVKKLEIWDKAAYIEVRKKYTPGAIQRAATAMGMRRSSGVLELVGAED